MPTSLLDMRSFVGAKMEACSFYRLNLSLLQCGNRTVAEEAASVFYGSNTFRFRVNQVWDLIHHFLDMIRHVNRSHLRSLIVEIGIRQLERVWSSRGPVWTWFMRGTFTSDEILWERDTPWDAISDCDKDWLDMFDIRPDIEACLRALRHTEP